MELKELIINMEKRPQMYITNLNIHILSTFIDGYLFGKKDLTSMEAIFQKSFSEWIVNYYDASLQKAWNETIYYYEGNHNKSMEAFFNLYKRWYESIEVDKG